MRYTASLVSPSRRVSRPSKRRKRKCDDDDDVRCSGLLKTSSSYIININLARSRDYRPVFSRPSAVRLSVRPSVCLSVCRSFAVFDVRFWTRTRGEITSGGRGEKTHEKKNIKRPRNERRRPSIRFVPPPFVVF